MFDEISLLVKTSIVCCQQFGHTVILFGNFKALYGSHSQSKSGLYLSISCLLALIFPNLKEKVAS